MQKGKYLLPVLLIVLYLVPIAYSDYANPYFEIVKGNVPGHSFIGFEGIDENVGTTEYALWAEASLYVYPTVATLMNVSSGSANDDNGNTGAWNVTIYGLNAAYQMINETVTMNGQAAVPTVNQYFRVNRMVVEHVGTNTKNVGIIYIGTGAIVAGKPTVVYNEIAAGWGISSTAIYTVPDGYTGYIAYFHIGTDSSKIIEIALQSRCLTSLGNSWSVDYHDHFSNQGVTHNLPLPFPYPEHTDIKVTARNSVGDAFATCDVFFILVEDGYELITDEPVSESQNMNNTILYIIAILIVVSLVAASRRRG